MDFLRTFSKLEDEAFPKKVKSEDSLEACIVEEIFPPPELYFEFEGENQQAHADIVADRYDDVPFVANTPSKEVNPDMISTFLKSDLSEYNVCKEVEMTVNAGEDIDVQSTMLQTANSSAASTSLDTKYCENVGACSTSSDNVIKCPHCSFTDIHAEEMAKHIINVHPSLYTTRRHHPCPECPRVFKSKWDLDYHFRTHSDERPFPCSECSYKAKRKTHLKTHMKLKHSKRQVVEEPKKTYCCPHCPNVYDNASRLLLHSYSHSGEHPYKCEVCGKRSRNAEELKRHLMKHQDGVNGKFEKRAMQKCPHCPYENFYETKLAEHIKIHEGEHPFECDQCDFKAKTGEHLMIHKAVHQNGKLFKCSKCEYSTNKEKTLTKHMTFHARGKKYSCKLCSNTFIHTTYLYQHMANDHNQKHFKCPELNCDFETYQKASIEHHKKQHLGEPTRVCSECGYTCHTPKQLMNHEISHFGKEPFKCPDCVFISVDIGKMRRHRKGGGRGNTCIRVKS